MTVSTPQATTETTESPRRPRRTRRVIASVALGLFVLVAAAGCTPAEMRAWWDWKGVDHSQLSDAEVQPWADLATTYWAIKIAEANDLARFNHVLSDAQLARLRQCESGGNYGAIGGGGAYRGAYQFARSSWNSVASQHYPRYVGMDPAAAPPEVQDAMTRALWSMSGPRPWPVCGYRV